MSGNGDRAPGTRAGRLAGRSVLITGAGSGLGRESALLFATEGANVVVTDLVPARVDRVVEQVRAAVGAAVGATADVRVAQHSVDAVALAVRTYGRLDGSCARRGCRRKGSARDESAYMSGVCLPATDGGNLARTSIIFPGGAAGVLPDALAQHIT